MTAPGTKRTSRACQAMSGPEGLMDILIGNRYFAFLIQAVGEPPVAAAIAAKRTSLTPEDAKDLAVRAVKFKKERGRNPYRPRRIREVI